MKTLTISDAIRNIDIDDTTQELAYSTGYICDVITEAADNAVPIYYCELDDYARDNPEMMRRALDEGLAMQPREYFDYHKSNDYEDYTRHIAAAACYLDVSDHLYESLNDGLMYIALYTLRSEFGDAAITESQLNEIRETVEGFDNNDTIEDVQEAARKVYVSSMFAELIDVQLDLDDTEPNDPAYMALATKKSRLLHEAVRSYDVSMSFVSKEVRNITE